MMTLWFGFKRILLSIQGKKEGQWN